MQKEGSIEQHMNEFLESRDFTGFLNAYSLYMCAGPSHENLPFYRAAALLCFLIEGSSVEFNTLLQNVSKEDVQSVENGENECLSVVFKVSDAIHRLDFDSLTSLCRKKENKKGENNRKADSLGPLVEEIVKRQQKIIENTMGQSPGEAEAITRISKDVLDSFKDCVFVVKNFMGN